MEAAAEEAQELWPASPTLSQWANGWWADLWHIPRGLSFRRLVALLGLHRFLLELLSGGTKADLPNDLRRFWCVCRVCACVCVFGTGSRCPTVRQFESVRHSANSVVRVGVDYQCVGLLFFDCPLCAQWIPPRPDIRHLSAACGCTLRSEMALSWVMITLFGDELLTSWMFWPCKCCIRMTCAWWNLVNQ